MGIRAKANNLGKRLNSHFNYRAIEKSFYESEADVEVPELSLEEQQLLLFYSMPKTRMSVLRRMLTIAVMRKTYERIVMKDWEDRK